MPRIRPRHDTPAQAIEAGTPASQPEGYPRLHAVAKWTVIAALALLSILAATFWTLLLGGYAASGFRADDPHRGSGLPGPITAECAWPYGVNDHNAEAMCRMFYRLTPEQREQVLTRRK